MGPKSEIARQLILAGGTISVQVLNEFASVLHRKFGLEWDAISEAVADLQIALGPILPIDVNTHSAAVDLARAHGFSFYDSLIVASSLGAGCEILFTEDLQAGRRIGNLTIINPFL
jgi:predicted nucleic acid-binding protein